MPPLIINALLASGTGKTLNVSNKLMTEMPADVVPVFMTFRLGASEAREQLGGKR